MQSSGIFKQILNRTQNPAPMGNKTFEILRHAVQLARDEQIGRVAALRSRLLDAYPDEEASISEALTAWADYAKKSKSD